MRDILALLLIGVAFAKIILAYYLVRSERIKNGTWLVWPLSRALLLAWSFAGTGVLIGTLGVLIMGGSSTSMPWWAVLIVGNVALAVGALWVNWARAPVIVADSAADPRDERGFSDAD